MIKRGWAWIAIFILSATLGFGYEITERARLGAVVEGVTYISDGPLAGKAAMIDGWSIYVHDPVLGNYEKLFSVSGLGFQGVPRGIAYLSQGDFAGNFLLPDDSSPNVLKIVSTSGTLTGLAYPQGFSWYHPEGLSQITSGPDQGKIAMIASRSYGMPYGIFIYSLEEAEGEIRAVFERELPEISAGLPMGIAFLPADFPDPSYAGMFAVSEIDPNGIAVIDASGRRIAAFPGIAYAEGLAFVPNGLHAGRLFLADMILLNSSFRSLDGSLSTPAPIPPVGLGIFSVQNINWLKDRRQFHIIEWDGYDYNMPGSLISRVGAGLWRRDQQFRLTHFRYTRNIAGLTADGTYKLFGVLTPRGVPNRFGVDVLDAGFNLILSLDLPPEYTGRSFGNLVYVPGVSPADDRYIAPAAPRSIHSFDPAFTYPATVINLSDRLTNNISKLCYDPSVQRYYVLDGTWLRVFNSEWDPLDAYDLTDIGAGPFSNMDKITSGELKGNVAVLNASDNELVILNFEFDLATGLLDRLIREVKAAGLANGLTISLISKLQNASKSIEKRNILPAINQVEAFISEIRAQSGKGIPSGLATAWLALASNVVRGLQQFL